MIQTIISLLVILWIISALATEYHPCKVQRFSEMAPRLLEVDHPRGVCDQITGDSELRESDSVSSQIG